MFLAKRMAWMLSEARIVWKYPTLTQKIQLDYNTFLYYNLNI